MIQLIVNLICENIMCIISLFKLCHREHEAETLASESSYGNARLMARRRSRTAFLTFHVSTAILYPQNVCYLSHEDFSLYVSRLF